MIPFPWIVLMKLPTELGGGLCLGYSPQGDMYGYYDCSGLGNPFCQKTLKMSNDTDDAAEQQTCPDGWTLSPTGTTCYWFDGSISEYVGPATNELMNVNSCFFALL